jgi:hypothetical protein
METIIVALISTLGVISTTIIQGIQARRKDNMNSKLTAIQIDFRSELKNIASDLRKEKLDRAKADLVGLMSRIQNGYIPTAEEKMILYETKEKYNALGGDSYVDDMFDKLKKEGKI